MLLALTGLVLLLTRRRASSAARHLVLTWTLVALPLLPLASALAPAWELGVLPDAPVAAEFLPADRLPVADTADAPAYPAPPVASPPRAAADPPATAPAPADAAGAGPAGVAPERSPTPALPLALLALYGAGVLALLAREAAGALRLRVLARASAEAPASVGAQAEEAVRALGVRRPVAVRVGAPGAPPMTWGTVRPVLLLPADAAEAWPAARLRAALLHEMAHISRWDALTQTLARLTCALWWWHPLVWAAARAQRAESERACDDRVLLAGFAGAEYADHLLAVARSLRAAARAAAPVPAAAVAMARPTPMKRRLLAVLDARLPRRAVSRRGAVLGGVLAAALLVPLAALRLVAPVSEIVPPGPEVIASREGVARLSDGTQVILNHIQTADGMHGDQRWTPDGELLPPARPHTGYSRLQPRHIFSASILNAKRPLIHALWRTPHPSMTFQDSTGYPIGHLPVHQISQVSASFPARMHHTDISIGLASSPAVISTWPLPGRPGMGRGFDPAPRFLSQNDEYGRRVVPPGARREALLQINLPPGGERYAYRIFLIDWLGRKRLPDSTAWFGKKPVRVIHFAQTNPRLIRAIQLEASAYQWVTFPNVPLAPPLPSETGGRNRWYTASGGKITLPDGTSVALDRILERPSGVGSVRHWASDGKPLPPQGTSYRPEDSRTAYRFDVRYTMGGDHTRMAGGIVLRGGVSMGTGDFSDSPYTYGGSASDEDRALQIYASERGAGGTESGTATVRIPITSRRWKTVAVARRVEGSSESGLYEGDFSVSRGYYPNMKAIELPPSVGSRPFRVVAVDRAGKMHAPESGTASGEDAVGDAVGHPRHFETVHAQFRGLEDSQIAEIRVQVAPHDWVEFRDVPLAPQVGPVVYEAKDGVALLPNGARVELLRVRRHGWSGEASVRVRASGGARKVETITWGMDGACREIRRMEDTSHGPRLHEGDIRFRVAHGARKTSPVAFVRFAGEGAADERTARVRFPDLPLE